MDLLTQLFSQDLRPILRPIAEQIASSQEMAPFFTIGEAFFSMRPSAESREGYNDSDVIFATVEPQAPEPVDILNAATISPEAVEHLSPGDPFFKRPPKLMPPEKTYDPVNGCSVCFVVFGEMPSLAIPCDCGAKVCAECLLFYFETESDLFPKCPTCFQPWKMAAYSSPPLCQIRKPLATLAARKMEAAASARESRFLSQTMPLASVYRRRRIVSEVLARLELRLQVQRVEATIDHLAGKETFALDEIAAVKEIESILEARARFDTDGRLTDDNIFFPRVGQEGIEAVFKLAVTGLLSRAFENPTSEASERDLASVAFVANMAELFFRFQINPNFQERVETVFPELLKPYRARELTVGELHTTLDFRVKSVAGLRHFVRVLPCEWWTMEDLFGISEQLYACAKKGLFETASTNRSMFHRPNAHSIQACSQPERPCFVSSCRGFMFKRHEPTRRGTIDRRSAAAAAAARRMAMAAPGRGGPSPATSEDASHFEIFCQLCETIGCYECHARLTKETREHHVCVPNEAESIALIRSTTKPCPRCAERISRTEGCRHMFCVRCKQPFDWETLQLHVANTNPEYHTWLHTMRQRVAGGRSVDDVEELRRIFSTDALGEDGLSSAQRLASIADLMAVRGVRTMETVMRVCERLDTFISVTCLSSIPTPADFEKLRVSYLLGGMTERMWVAHISKMERRSFIAKQLIASLSTFIEKTLAEAKAVFNSLEPRGFETRRQAEFLRKAARWAADASESMEFVFDTHPASGETLFPNARKFCAAAVAEDVTFSQPSMCLGGSQYGNAGDTEEKRVRSIFESKMMKPKNGIISFLE